MIKINEKFPIPEGHVVLFQVGPYSFTEYNEEGYLVGGKVRKFKDEYEVSKLCIQLTQKQYCNQSILDAFDLDDNIWYYSVSDSKFSFMFENVGDALSFIAFMLGTYEKSLNECKT